MIKLFKLIATLEGISLLLLLFVGMPLKYVLESPLTVKYVGWAHGLLFIAYVVLATVLKPDEKWSFKTYVLVLIASLLPFGTFVMEAKLLKNHPALK
ncbi:DUF3817 domain-containing protein [Myroides sp. LJL119]